MEIGVGLVEARGQHGFEDSVLIKAKNDLIAQVCISPVHYLVGFSEGEDSQQKCDLGLKESTQNQKHAAAVFSERRCILVYPAIELARNRACVNMGAPHARRLGARQGSLGTWLLSTWSFSFTFSLSNSSSSTEVSDRLNYCLRALSFLSEQRRLGRFRLSSFPNEILTHAHIHTRAHTKAWV